MNVARPLGVILRLRRNQQKLTQTDLAGMAETDRSFISDVENGKRNLSINTFIRICQALEIQPWEVLRDAMTTKGRQK